MENLDIGNTIYNSAMSRTGTRKLSKRESSEYSKNEKTQNTAM